MSDEYFDICREDIPAWYEVGYDVENRQLIISVHEVIAHRLDLLKSDQPVVSRVTSQEGISLDEYVEPREGNWGFGAVLQKVENSKKPFISYAVNIPQIIYPIFGKSQFDANDNWKAGYNICASLQIFFRVLYLGRRDEICWQTDRFQLARISTFIKEDIMGSCPIGATLSRQFVSWLMKYPERTEINEVSQAMRNVYDKLVVSDQNSTDKYDTNVSIGSERGILYLSCPGDRCGLNAEHNAIYEISNGKGYDLGDHNVDNPMQQLTLLAGMAALCDLCRADLFPEAS